MVKRRADRRHVDSYLWRHMLSLEEPQWVSGHCDEYESLDKDAKVGKLMHYTWK